MDLLLGHILFIGNVLERLTGLVGNRHTDKLLKLECYVPSLECYATPSIPHAHKRCTQRVIYLHVSSRTPRKLIRQTYIRSEPPFLIHSSRKDLYNPIATSTNHESPVLTPSNIAHTFAPHSAMRDDVLRTDALFQGPKADTCVVACGDGFAAVFREGKGGDG